LRYRAAIDLANTLKFLPQRPPQPVSFFTTPTSKHDLLLHFTLGRKRPEADLKNH
jgi:hypothetical protein